jgi:hypothetical protein
VEEGEVGSVTCGLAAAVDADVVEVVAPAVVAVVVVVVDDPTVGGI